MDWSRHRKRALAVAAGLLVFAAGAWAAAAWRAEARLARVQELRKQLTADAAKGLPPEQQRERWQQLGRAMKELSPEQRRELSKGQHSAFQASLDRYFTLPKCQQVAHLGAEIDKREAARKKWAAPGGRGPDGGKGADGRGGPPADRERRRKELLDRSTPQERAKMAELAKQMNARRQQRGLPATTGGFGFGPR